MGWGKFTTVLVAPAVLRGDLLLGMVILKIARKIVRISEKASRKAFVISTIFLALLSSS